MSIQKALELDKQLMSKNILDGSKVIYRRSPFNAQRDHLILDLKNKVVVAPALVQSIIGIKVVEPV